MSDNNNATEAPYQYIPTEEDNVSLAQALADSRARKGVPKNRYKVKVLKAEFKISAQKKTPFFNFECELADNPPSFVQGQQVDVNGQKGYFSVFLTAKSIGRLGAFHESCGLPLDINLAQILSNPSAGLYEGKTFHAICYSEPTIEKDHMGNAIKDGRGQDIVSWKFNIQEVA